MGFPDSSVGKESTYNAGNPSLISELERSAGDGIVYPLQCSWASLVAQLVKNLPAMWESWVRSLGWEDPPEKGKATHSSILAWRIPRSVSSMGSQRVGHNWATFTFAFTSILLGVAGGKESACQCRRCRCRFDSWVGKIPWRRKWHPTPVFLLGKFHGQRSLVGYSPWGCEESDTT